MKALHQKIIRFFQNQNYTIITTIGKDGCPHNSCKGIVGIDEKGQVFLLDLYKGNTYENLKRNPSISITAVDEHKFIGYSLKGRASIVKREEIKSGTMESWDSKITKRISRRLLRNIRGEKGHPLHPEALLPRPEYLIVAEIKNIIDLTPRHIKERR